MYAIFFADRGFVWGVQIPIGGEDLFAGVVDLVTMEGITWDGEELGASFKRGPIPEDLQAQAEEYREKMIEQVWPCRCNLISMYTAFEHYPTFESCPILLSNITVSEHFLGTGLVRPNWKEL